MSTKSQQTTITDFVLGNNWQQQTETTSMKRKNPTNNYDNARRVKKGKISGMQMDPNTSQFHNNELMEMVAAVNDASNEKQTNILINAIEKRIEPIEKKLVEHDKALNFFDQRLNDLEQQRLNSQIEVSGLEFSKTDVFLTIRQKFLQYLLSIGVDVEMNEIVDGYARTRTVQSIEKVVVIIIFMHEAIKNRIMKAKIEHDKTIDRTEIFFSPVLTKINHKLLMAARKLMRDGQIARAWSMSGSIYVKKTPDGRKIKIINWHHLKNVCNENVERADDSEEMEFTQCESEPSKGDNNVNSSDTSRCTIIKDGEIILAQSQ